jgi:putative membrane protein
MGAAPFALARTPAFHRDVNGAVKQQLIPAADNKDLKSLLETGLALFGEHQTHAEHLAREIR